MREGSKKKEVDRTKFTLLDKFLVFNLENFFDLSQ